MYIDLFETDEDFVEFVARLLLEFGNAEMFENKSVLEVANESIKLTLLAIERSKFE